jgi:hypothetical protein
MARAQLTGILLAQTTTYVGLQLFMFVAPWWALGFTESPLAPIGIFLAITLANTLPGPLVGHLVDKSDPLRLLQTARILTVLLLAVIALISFVKLESIGLVCLLVGLVGFTEFLYSTAFFSAVPRFIDRQGLLGLGSRLETINAVAGILAPVVAGHLLVLGNFTVAFGAVAALLALGLLGFRGASAGKIGGEEDKSPGTESSSKTGFVQGLHLSVRQTLADKKLLYLIAIPALANVAMAPLGALVLAAVHGLGLGAREAGWATSAFAGGVLAATLLLARFSTPRHLYPVGISVLVLGLGTVITGAVGYPYMLVGSFLAGGGTIALGLYARTLMQTLAGPSTLGKSLALQRTLRMSLRPLGLVLAGVGAELFGSRAAIAFLGFYLLIVGSAGLWFVRKT